MRTSWSWSTRLSATAILLLLAAAGPLLAQQGTISGRVTDDATQQPLGGARVQLTGTSLFALSNAQGTYTIRGVAPGTHQVRIILLGFASIQRSVTVPAGGTATVDWAIHGVPFTLEEIVTTATGEQLSRELGNTVGRIEAPQLVQTAPVTNITQVLSGRVAGVNVMQSNGVTGQSARIRVRGISSVSLSNEPVVYIDGVRVASESPIGAFIGGGTVSHLNDLNPEEIESIEIVKGPSAATLYGTQAANGVIRVTTKRGRAGAPQWNVWLEGGLLKDTYEYPSTWFSSRVGSTTLACLPYQQALGQCQIDQLHKLSLLEQPETTPFGTGNREQAGASVSGGTEAIRYFVSADWERELGLLKLADSEEEYLKAERDVDEIPVEQRRPNELRKFSGRVNVSSTIGSKLDINVSSGYIDNDIRLPQTGDNFQTIIGSPILGSANPTIVAVTGGYGFARPADGLGEVTWRRNDHFTNSANANWRALPWLTARGTLGLDYLAYVDEQNVFNGQGCKTCGTER
ncbi:MAG TPA: TonB-dependent receptor plug domain-containing protein, partial [Gemmatimonadales bacterium]